MSIKDFIKKSKCFVDNNNDMLIAFIIILVAFGSFGLGRLSKIDELKTPIRIENITASVIGATKTASKTINHKQVAQKALLKQGGVYIGSKNGTKYFFPWCSGAKRIKDANKITFKTKVDAQDAGYAPARNCKGLR